nr:PIF1-like helicase [Tanacetum cinerariifolium]
TTKQQGVYDTVMNSVEMKKGSVYFVYGYGGGRTALPINVDDTSHCFISAQSDTEALLKRCKLIIWDEAPMNGY